MAKFKAGDIVQLKSGGPQMTINQVVEPDNEEPIYIDCVWFSGKKLEGGRFLEEAITAYTDSNDTSKSQ